MLNDKEDKPKAKISLRFADSTDDLDLIRPLSIELHETSRFRDIPYSHEKRDKLLSQAIDKPEQYALVIAEIDGDPIGFIFCGVGEYLVGTEKLMTTVFSFFVRKRYRETMIGGKAALRLLSTVIEWSKQRNSREVLIHVTSGIDIQRTDKFLRRARFKVIGANYAFTIGSDETAP